MVVCPVCEHTQAAGTECEVCGHRLRAPLDADQPVAVMDGLESTLQPAAPEPPPEVVPGLELTGAAPVEVPGGDRVADLEQTGNAPVDPPIDALPVERTGDGAPADERTPYPAMVNCRYCRTPAAPGEKLCSRCGMRRPLPSAPAAAPPAGVGPQRGSGGVPVVGPRCPACGARTTTA